MKTQKEQTTGKYKLIYDTGKPSEEDFNNKEDLFSELLRLDCLSTTEESPYFDITILKENKDVTDEIFKEFNKFKGKQAIQDFESMQNMAELKALSKYSLENPLNDNQFKRMMELKKVLGL